MKNFKRACALISLSALVITSMPMNVVQAADVPAGIVTTTDNAVLKSLGVDTWKTGRYINGSTYSSWPSYICQKEFLEVSPYQGYSVHISDSNYFMVLCQLDENMKLLSTKTFYDGGEFIADSNAKYVSVSLSHQHNSQIFSGGFQSLFDEGLTINFTETDVKQNIEDVNFNNYGLWDNGSINDKGVHFFTWNNCSLIDSVKCTPNTEYLFTSDYPVYFSVHEYDNDGNYIGKTSIRPGNTFMSGENTTNILITLGYNNLANYKVRDSIYNGKISFDVSKVKGPHVSTVMADKDFSDSIVLDSNTVWYQGSYEAGEPTDNDNFVKDNVYYKVGEEVNTLELKSEDIHGRILVAEYDKDKKFIKSSDYCSESLLYLNSKTEYFTISTYVYKDSSIEDNDYDSLMNKFTDGQKLTITSVNPDDYLHGVQKVFTGELTGNDISNLGIYQYGSYASWVNTYNDNGYYGPSRLLFEVTPGTTYYFNTNDSRFGVSLTNNFD